MGDLKKPLLQAGALIAGLFALAYFLSPPHRSTPREQVIAQCKLETLRHKNPDQWPYPGGSEAMDYAIENFFDACMESKGYIRPKTKECQKGEDRPAAAYVRLGIAADHFRTDLAVCYEPMPTAQ